MKRTGCYRYLCIIFVFFSPSSWALTTPLTLFGAQQDGVAISVTLSLTELENMPQKEFFTHLPWIQSGAKFTGVSLKYLLNYYKVDSGTITLTALNDYSTKITWQDIEKYDPIIALKKNDRNLRIRDYGPYWLVYPTDTYPEIKIPEYDSQMIWQIKSIRVE